MNVVDYLNSKKVRFELKSHRPSFTAQQMAAEEHVPGMEVAKPVLVQADGQYYLCVLPACCKIDLAALQNNLSVNKVRLADENELAAIFTDCELGAEPPFGKMYKMETLMDKALEKDDYITFQAGTHQQAIRMKLADYKNATCPKVLNFSYHSR